MKGLESRGFFLVAYLRALGLGGLEFKGLQFI